MNSNLRYHLFLFSLSALLSLTACKKMVEVPSPPTGLTSDNIFTDDAMAASVLTAIYTEMAKESNSQSQLIGEHTIKHLSLLAAVGADELTVYGGNANANTLLLRYYHNQLLPGNSTSSPNVIWNEAYRFIYIVNLALERLTVSTNLTPAVRSQLMGEAYFIRAFYYFYLVNLYGPVPLATTSDYRVTNTLGRTGTEQVYQQIISDLQQAQTHLLGQYVNADAKTVASDRARPNKAAATALLARAYLYDRKWSEAEAAATALIQNSLYDTVPIAHTFKKESREVIWQLQPVRQGWNTGDARLFILPVTGPNTSSSTPFPVHISESLIYQFDQQDRRFQEWIGSVNVNNITYYYPWKYKSATLNAPVTEYMVVMRLAEQYLIRAEAKAQQNKISEARDDLDFIRKRAGLDPATANDRESLLTAIDQERRKELFTEWGHRWLDLKRRGKIDEVMNVVAPLKGTTWHSNWQWWPLPAYDIFQNPNLSQNTGY